MNTLQLASLSESSPGDTITDVLGIVAVCSFFAITCYIFYQILRNASRNAVAAPVDLGVFREVERVAKEPEPKEEVDELEQLEKHLQSFYADMVQEAGIRLEDFARCAEDTFNQVADGYASNSFGLEGETHSVRCQKFLVVCERQWSPIRGDIGYMSNLDVLEHLRPILANHRMLDSQYNAASDTKEMSPALMRSQELVALMRVVPKDKVRFVQEQLLKAVESFADRFHSECKVWLNEQIVKIAAEMRPRKSRSVQITDTDQYKKFKQLKLHLEMVARLADGISENTQQVSESGLALSQVIHVGTVLRILACLRDWFTELELGSLEPVGVEQREELG